ncbi:MAG: MBL fold metallo-hydrolase [Acidobacteria bacterium]|nr:MBL fold metallo-hydrolase [Acidobacteriota bacterium]
MFRTLTMSAVCAALLSAGCGGGPRDAQAVLADVNEAMATEGLQSITYSGTAQTLDRAFLQTAVASPPWPMYDISNYSRTIDLTAPASRATGTMFHGGVFLRPPTEQPYEQQINADETAWNNQLEIWLTPWGFLRGAEMYGAEVGTAEMGEAAFTTLTWQSPESQTSPSGMRYTVTGYINDQNLVSRVETQVEHVMMGDLQVAANYSDYREMDGVMVPASMEQERAGGTSFTVAVESATANPADLTARLTPPPAEGNGGGGGGGGGRGGGPAPDPADLVRKVYDGVYLVGGGYEAMIVEFTDFVVVFEGGAQNENRGQQVLAATRATVPNKPIRYVVNSHFHSDHSSGLAAWAREGITILTHEENVPFAEMALSNPRTLLGEPTMDPTIEGVEDVMVIEDAMNRMEIVHIPNPHAEHLLGVYLPRHSHFHQADLTLFPDDPSPAHIAFAERVRELGMEFDTLTGVHPAPNPESDDDVLVALQQ